MRVLGQDRTRDARVLRARIGEKGVPRSVGLLVLSCGCHVVLKPLPHDVVLGHVAAVVVLQFGFIRAQVQRARVQVLPPGSRVLDLLAGMQLDLRGKGREGGG
jgi:hypothetical protein